MRSRVFLRNFDVFGNVIKEGLDCFDIYSQSNIGENGEMKSEKSTLIYDQISKLNHRYELLCIHLWNY